MQTLLSIHNLRLGYQDQVVVDDLSFNVNQGEICSLLGPSGCGKTTTLRAIAGFEGLLDGEIKLLDRSLSTPNQQVQPEDRGIGMVFQDYALFPHLSVADNIAFGLKNHPRKQARINELLSLVKLESMNERFPHELSGGQQQRVALARALAPEPKLLLMDEPFSNLDVDLRRRLSQEVRAILKDLGISAILVTHDQEEAFSFSDRVGVINEGRLLQWDTPYELYHEPVSPYVANFIGQGKFLRGQMSSCESITTELGELKGNRAYTWVEGTQVDLLLRPDDVIADKDSPYRGTISEKIFMGAVSQYSIKLATGSTVDSLIASHHDFNVGEEIGIRVVADHLVVFEGNSTCSC